jgi:polar amino acid transport system substrate-binding protein
LAAAAAILAAAWGAPAAAAPAWQATEDDWARVKASGKLVVGTSADYPPFEFYSSNNELDGFDIALFKELGKRLGVEVEFNDFAFDGLLDALRVKQVDAAIGAISVTPERQKIVDFTNLYYVGEDAVLARATSKDTVNSATDLKDQRIGVQLGTTYQSWAQQHLVDKGLIAQGDLAAYEDVNAMVRDLRNKKIDAALLGLLPAQAIDKQYRDLRVIGSKFNKQQFGIAARTGSTLIAELNQALLEIQSDGAFAELVTRYLGVKASDVTPDAEDNQPEPPAPVVDPDAPPPCIYSMAYVADLNYDDKGMTAPPVMKPGQEFTKQWRIKNAGTCAWEPNYQLAYAGGNRAEAQMGGSAVNIGRRVEPGALLDIGVNLRAPMVYGTFKANWKMRDAAGRFFGEVIWVGIQVPDPNPPAPPPTPQPSGNVNPRLRADANPVAPGQCTAIRWDVDNVNAVFFINGGNVEGVGGHDTRNVCPAATTTYVLRVTRADNANVDFPITVQVTAGPQPPSIKFWVDNGTINAGQCTTARWDVQNVQGVYFNEQGVPGVSSQQVCPPATTTYTLRVVRNDGGQETRQAVVNVVGNQPGPVITGFTVDRNEIAAGECVNLAWSSLNAGSVNLNRNGVMVIQNATPSGGFQDCLGQSGLYEYVLTAFGNGQVQQKLTVNVLGLPQ